MTPNLETPTDAKAALAVFIALAVMAGIFLPILLFSIADERQRRKRMTERMEERRRAHEEMLRLINDDFRRQQQSRLEQQVRRQIADQPAVTLPVTYCERRTRRRFLPLENDRNATG